MLNANFVYLGSFIFLLGSVSYFIDTLKGKTKPNRISWFLWGLNPLIAFAAMIQQGVGLSSLATFTYGAVPFVILLASFLNKKSYWQIGKVDLACGMLSVCGIILWFLTKTGTVAILLSIVADLLASIPTIIKSYQKPETESWFFFLTNSFSAGITLLTISALSFSSVAFPLYIFLDCVLITVLVRFKLGRKINLLISTKAST